MALRSFIFKDYSVMLLTKFQWNVAGLIGTWCTCAYLTDFYGWMIFGRVMDLE